MKNRNDIPDWLEEEPLEPVKAPASQKPWKELNPKSKPSHVLNLRLNEYQLAMLRFLAEKQDDSLQKTIKKILIPQIESECERLARGDK